jgi:hypothetical protein
MLVGNALILILNLEIVESADSTVVHARPGSDINLLKPFLVHAATVEPEYLRTGPFADLDLDLVPFAYLALLAKSTESQPSFPNPRSYFLHPATNTPVNPSLAGDLIGLSQVILEHRLHLIGKVFSQYYSVDLVILQKAALIQIGGAHRGPHPINYCGLGMQQCSATLIQFHSSIQEV